MKKIFGFAMTAATALVALNAATASAADLICNKTITESNSLQMPVTGQPSPPSVTTSYHLTLSIAGIGTPSMKLNASLGTSVLSGNGGSQDTISPIASLKSGVGGYTLSHANGRAILFNPSGMWIVSIDESEVQQNAGKPNILQFNVNSRFLSDAMYNSGAGDIDQVDCVAF